MSGLRITIKKGSKSDTIEIERHGAAPLRFDFPKKGPVPHDVVHLIVEGALGMTRGFWGMVAEGVDPAEVQEIAKAAGHASASRAGPPGPHIVELIQAERLVECFEADLWSPGSGVETFRGVAAAACAASHVPCPDLPATTVETIRTRIAEFFVEWRDLSAGQSKTFAWPK